MRRPQLRVGDQPASSRWGAVREPVLDTTGAALLWTAMAVDLATRPLTTGQSVSTPAAYLWAAMITGPFAVHRRYPVIAVLVSDLGLIAYSLGRYSAFPGYATFAIVFAVALHAGRRTALVVYLLGMAGLVAALVFQPAGIATAWSWISTLLTVTVAWLAGENLKARRARRRHELDEAHRQAELQAEEARRLIRQQAEEERRAISEERLRIARDLHDIVAHSMSVIAVQAGVAHHILDERPEVARDALGSIEVTARQGLVEMRRMLGVLRSEDDSTDHAPTTPAARPRWTSPRTGSSRKGSPTCCATADRSRTSTFSDHPPSCGSKSAMTVDRKTPHRPPQARVTGSPGSESGPHCSTARSGPNPCPAGDSGSR